MADADSCFENLVKERGAVDGLSEADADRGEADSSVRVRMRRILLAKEFKNAGNVCYRGGKYRDAAGRYHRALLQLRGLLDSGDNQQMAISLSLLMGHKTAKPSDEEVRVVQSVEIDCYNNLAACMLHMEPVKYERIKEYCVRVLEQQPRNGKALYRAGVACFHLGDCDAASTFLSGAKEIQPGDPNIDKYIQMTKAKLETHLEEEKAM
uniref:tetratricopeptide repeat protein 9C n=1 Tax=Myxine glutinosa TaxID=7769 RepID=UPI00358EF34E